MKLLKIKLFFNILLTIVFLLWAINLFLPSDLQIAVGHYWWWFTTTLVLVIERWTMFIVFDDEVKELVNKWKKKKEKN